jgi:hypothetical protein
MTFRGPAANKGENRINFDQQTLIVAGGRLLLKRWRPTTNPHKTTTRPGGAPQGPGEGTTLTTRQRNRIDRIDRTL